MARSPLKRRVRREPTGDLSDRLTTLMDPDSAASEAYRTLRTSLLYASVDTPPKVIVVTSPGAVEGKSSTCANLGVVLAQAGKNTLIVDCDFRRPAMHKLFGLRNLRGIVDFLAGVRDLEEIRQEASLRGLSVITTGPIPPNPAELLSSMRFVEFLSQVREEFDYVLIDVPPTELVSDSAITAAHGDGVLLVFDSQSTRKGSVRRSVRTLRAVGATVLGTVMNNVKASTKASYHYGYGYSYELEG